MRHDRRCADLSQKIYQRHADIFVFVKQLGQQTRANDSAPPRAMFRKGLRRVRMAGSRLSFVISEGSRTTTAVTAQRIHASCCMASSLRKRS